MPRPDAQYSLLFEMSAPAATAMARLTEMTLRWLHEHRFLDRARIVSLWGTHTQFGYPTPTLDRDDVLASIHHRLEPVGVHTRGRLGGWVYERSNQDATYQQGRDIIDTLLLTGPAARATQSTGR